MKRLAHKLGRRGATLLVLAIFDFIFGWFFFDPNVHQSLQQIDIYRGLRDFASLYAWGVMWWLVGIICLVSAFRRKDAIGFVAAILIQVAWVVGLMSAWILWDAKYAWAQAALWASLCAWVAITAGWPEPPPPIVEEKIRELGS